MMTDGRLEEEGCTVAVVGGGTSGLALAAELMRLKVGKVVVLEREQEAGGVPRHCAHYPFGIGEYRRLLRGPDYARRNRDLAQEAGAEIRTGTAVIRLLPGGVIEVSRDGRRARLRADRVVLCTGIRESSRAQRLIGGDRPGGVLSTGALQAMVHSTGQVPFRRPVILGSELVSFAAIGTCRTAGIAPVAMVEEYDRPAVRGVMVPYLWVARLPFHGGVRDLRIEGLERVEAVGFTDRRGARILLEADGVIVSGRFRPEAALLHASHLEVDPNSGGPVVDQFGRCSDPAYFATGNLLRPAETSGFCWREGVETARRVAADLKLPQGRGHEFVTIAPADPAIRFVVPQRLSLSDEGAGMERMYLGLNEAVRGRISAVSGGRTLWAATVDARPVRRIRFPLADILGARPGLPVEIRIERRS